MLLRDLDALNADWSSFTSDCNDAKVALEKALKAWNEFESLYTALSQWLRAKEQLIKEFELKSTLEEKNKQVEILKVR